MRRSPRGESLIGIHSSSPLQSGFASLEAATTRQICFLDSTNARGNRTFVPTLRVSMRAHSDGRTALRGATPPLRQPVRNTSAMERKISAAGPPGHSVNPLIRPQCSTRLRQS